MTLNKSLCVCVFPKKVQSVYFLVLARIVYWDDLISCKNLRRRRHANLCITRWTKLVLKTLNYDIIYHYSHSLPVIDICDSATIVTVSGEVGESCPAGGLTRAQETEQVLGTHNQIWDVELISHVPAHRSIVTSVLHHAVEEAQAVQQSLEGEAWLATRVELIIWHHVWLVETDQVGFDSLGLLDNDLDTSLLPRCFII